MSTPVPRIGNSRCILHQASRVDVLRVRNLTRRCSTLLPGLWARRVWAVRGSAGAGRMSRSGNRLVQDPREDRDLRGPWPECSGTDAEEIGMLAKVSRAVPQDVLRDRRISDVEPTTAPREHSTVSTA